jgi:uncharacterized membrane protein YeaQ/YmgE (transglycosylase-associated protein family)
VSSIPSATFSLLLAVLYGALAHLITGGPGRQLVVYIIASCVGFAIGQGVGVVMNIKILAIGPANLLPATLGSIIALGTTILLSTRKAAGKDE